MTGICIQCGVQHNVSIRRGCRIADHRCTCGGRLRGRTRAEIIEARRLWHLDHPHVERDDEGNPLVPGDADQFGEI